MSEDSVEQMVCQAYAALGAGDFDGYMRPAPTTGFFTLQAETG